ncbi:MAG: LacI family DNA-binding transcriptional regulator [Chloroflexi bacterium]|nr:LacI family DNA-binding transcriptional regulator [Chloroflexota bacterium]
MPQVTVYDVAGKAGVSISTISRVLNAPEKVNAATRERVLTAIDELGFVPKAEAVARSRRVHGRIGVLAPFLTYPSFVQRLKGVATALSDSRYELVIYYIDSLSRLNSTIASLAVTRRLDGVIMMALPVEEAAANRLRRADIETVLVEYPYEGFSSIEIDDLAGGRLAAEYLLAQGHRRLGFVGDAELPDYAIHNSERRLAGYRAAIESAGLTLPDDRVGLAPHAVETARQQAHRLLDLPEPPTAVFCHSDTQAMGVLKAARERGVAVPHGLAIVGFDDLEVAEFIGLTTVRQPLEESGRVAVELLLARLADRSRAVQRVWLPLTLVRRETA